MSLPGPTASAKFIRFFAYIAAGLTCVLGLIVLVGWWTNVDFLRCLIPGSTPLKPNIAIGFLFSGIALGIMCGQKPGKPLRIFAGCLASIVVVLGVLTLAEHSLRWELGIDDVLVRQFPASLGTLHDGRMQPTTAFCFLLGGCALLAESLCVTQRFVSPLVSGLSGALLTVGIAALTGYFLEKIFGPQLSLLGMNVSGVTAAVGFLLLGAGLLALLQSQAELSWWVDRVTSVGFVVAIVLTVVTTAA